MSDLHKRLSSAFIQLEAYINEGKTAQGVTLFEKVVRAELKKELEEKEARITTLENALNEAASDIGLHAGVTFLDITKLKDKYREIANNKDKG